jgi:hypothetical protein
MLAGGAGFVRGNQKILNFIRSTKTKTGLSVTFA